MMIYLFIGILASIIIAFTAEAKGIPYPPEFNTGLMKLILYGIVSTSWPFILVYVIAYAKNNS